MAREVLVHAPDLARAAKELIVRGGRLVHVLTDHLLVISVPDDVEAAALEHVTTEIPETLTRHEHRLAQAWRERFGELGEFALEEAASAPAIAWDTEGFTPPDPPAMFDEGMLESMEPEAESTGTPTSLYLTGSVAVGIVMVSGQPWTTVSGSLKYVSAASDGTVWGVNANDEIYQRSGSGWTRIAGSLKQISAGSAAHVWGVNAADQIYQWNGTGWTHVAGSLKHVSVGSDGTVWGVNANDEIYRRSGTAWVQVAGALTQISVANAATVWGVNSAGNVLRWNGSVWKQVSGSLKHVSVAPDGSVFGVNASDQIFRRVEANSTWQPMHGTLKQISAGSAAMVWGVNASNVIFSGNSASGLDLTGTDESKIMSEVLEGLAFLASAEPLANVTFVYDWRSISVSVTPGPVPPLSDKYEPYEAPWRDAALQSMGYPGSRQGSVDYVNWLKTSKATNWAYAAYFTKYPLGHFAYAGQERLVMSFFNDNWTPDQINQVFAHETGHIFGAADEYGSCSCSGSGQYNVPNSNCKNCTTTQAQCLMNANTLQLCNASRGQIGWSTWEPVSGGLKYISVGADGTTWGVNANDQVYRRNGSAWTPVAGSLKQISVGNAMYIWGVNANDEVFQWNGGGWTLVAGSLKHVAVGNDGTVWGVNAADQIFRRSGSAWAPVAGSLKEVSVGSAANVWGVNASNDIYQWNGTSWVHIAGALKCVSAASDGTVWGVNASDQIFRRNGNAWQQVHGSLKQISAGAAAHLWGVNASDNIYQRRVLATP